MEIKASSLGNEHPQRPDTEPDTQRRHGLSRTEVRTLALCSLGSALEYYDFTVFVFFAGVMGKLFFPPSMPDWLVHVQTFAIFAVGFIVRPIGGTIIAHFGDRLGRKKLFMFTIFLMAVPTLLIGLLPTYAQVGAAAPLLLLLLRICQGLAVAGELPGAAVFITEHIPGSRVGLGCGSFFGALYLGLFLGALCGALTSSTLDAAAVSAYGWRIAFIVGGLFGLVSVYLRRYLDETPLFEAVRQRKALAQRIPLKEVLLHHRPACWFVVGLAFFLSEAIVVLFQYMPTYLQTAYHLPREAVFQANSLAILVLAAMNPVWGWIGDRIGLGRALAVGAVLMAGSTWWFFAQVGAAQLGTGSVVPAWLLVAMASGVIGLVPSLAAVVFPTEVRFTGFAFPYNIGAALFAGLTPLALSWSTHAIGGYAAPTLVLVACAVGLALGLWSKRMTFFMRSDGATEHA